MNQKDVFIGRMSAESQLYAWSTPSYSPSQEKLKSLPRKRISIAAVLFKAWRLLCR